MLVESGGALCLAYLCAIWVQEKKRAEMRKGLKKFFVLPTEEKHAFSKRSYAFFSKLGEKIVRYDHKSIDSSNSGNDLSQARSKKKKIRSLFAKNNGSGPVNRGIKRREKFLRNGTEVIVLKATKQQTLSSWIVA